MRIIKDVVQGSEEWLALRLGIPTASRFSKILTPTGQLSKSSIDFMYELIAEDIIGQPCDTGQSAFMERGTQLEPDAIAQYEFERSIDVQRVGFCLTDDGLVGCSPDGLVGDDGGLEIKCPSAKVQIAHILNEPAFVADYKCQVQGCLYVTGRKWWDLMSYSPVLPSPIIRIERDEEYIAKLDSALREFNEKLLQLKQQVKSMRMVEVLPEGWPFGKLEE